MINSLLGYFQEQIGFCNLSHTSALLILELIWRHALMCRVLEGLQHLEVLSLSSNRLSTLPPGVFTLPALQDLDLSHNDLSSLPTDITLLQSLEVSAYMRPEPCSVEICPAEWCCQLVYPKFGDLSHSGCGICLLAEPYHRAVRAPRNL